MFSYQPVFFSVHLLHCFLHIYRTPKKIPKTIKIHVSKRYNFFMTRNDPACMKRFERKKGNEWQISGK
ncbi:hypothetical protein CHCC20372_0302 [Bacillus paralicheniformis]|nr:hypothetical protein CHCC20372_0302 [Bacillus paralicheniformis]